MFSSIIQPSIVSLFSSTSTSPLKLFTSHTDNSLPSDSFIHLVNDHSSLPHPPPPASLISPPPMTDHGQNSVHEEGYCIDQTVLHIQSPTMHTTHIQCPPTSLSGNHSKCGDMGLKLPWMHLQVRNLGRPWSFEVGVVDQSGRVGVLRMSTFQKQPRLKLSTGPDTPPLLHLPLSFPTTASRPLTAWSDIALHLPSFLPYLSSLDLIALDDSDNESRFQNTALLPSGKYSHVQYVRIYATCRLRRIWFAETGLNQKIPWEFELYGKGHE